jgi:hypothetical protein
LYTLSGFYGLTPILRSCQRTRYCDGDPQYGGLHWEYRNTSEDPACKKLAEDPTEAVEQKTIVLTKKSSLLVYMAEQLRTLCTRSPRLYVQAKIHRDEAPLRLFDNTIEAPSYSFAEYLAGLLVSRLCKSVHHVKNSADLVPTLDTLRVSPKDILVSFDVVSLFTKVPLQDVQNPLSRHFEEHNLTLFTKF